MQHKEIIRIHHECEGGIAKSIPRMTVWHHKACRMMTNGDYARDRFADMLRCNIHLGLASVKVPTSSGNHGKPGNFDETTSSQKT